MFRPRSPVYLIAVGTALEVLAWRTLAPSPTACPHIVAGRVDGVDATVTAAMRAERRACRVIAADRSWTACEVR